MSTVLRCWRLCLWRARGRRRRLPAQSIVACVSCGCVGPAGAMIGRHYPCMPPRRSDEPLCGACFGQECG